MASQERVNPRKGLMSHFVAWCKSCEGWTLHRAGYEPKGTCLACGKPVSLAA